MQLFWCLLFIASFIAHLMWPLPFELILETRIRSVVARTLLYFSLWVAAGVACNGCPFVYLHEWIAVQAGWREKITYKYEDSIVYQYVIEPLFGPDSQN